MPRCAPGLPVVPVILQCLHGLDMPGTRMPSPRCPCGVGFRLQRTKMGGCGCWNGLDNFQSDTENIALIVKARSSSAIKMSALPQSAHDSPPGDMKVS